MITTEMTTALLDGLYEGVYFVDRDRRITFWNEAAERISGFSGAQVLGRACREGLLCHVDDKGNHLCEKGCPLQATMEDGQRRTAHVFLRHAQGHRVPVRVASSPVRDPDGRIVGAVESFFEDAEWRETEARAALLEKYAFIDTLTELPNRRYLEQRISLGLDELNRYGWPCGVLMVDVDKFKPVNDTYGHDVGDALLRMVARSLQGGMRGSDLVGRWGGEEFLALVTNADPEILVVVAERMRALVSASGLRAPAEIAVTISVGVAAARPGESAADIVKRADANLYRAKELGRNMVWAGEP
jgi:diguanylate cyclase (GGDEF)-like protein/PAS domain S-box-containing protein